MDIISTLKDWHASYIIPKRFTLINTLISVQSNIVAYVIEINVIEINIYYIHHPFES